MLLMINFTGLNKVYYMPKISRNTDHSGLWYFDLKFLNIQLCLFSKELGSGLIKKVKETL